MQDLRRHPRKVIQLALEISLADGRVIAGHTQDISVGGAFLTIPEALDFGLEIQIDLLDLPGMGRTRLPGIVRWNRPDGVGVQFGLLGARVTHALTELMSHTA